MLQADEGTAKEIVVYSILAANLSEGSGREELKLTLQAKILPRPNKLERHSEG